MREESRTIDLVNTPLVLEPGQCVNVKVTIDGQDRHVTIALVQFAVFRYVHQIRVQITGEDDSGYIVNNQSAIPWRVLGDIAAYVAGDGTDPQCVALADGIREGRMWK